MNTEIKIDFNKSNENSLSNEEVNERGKIVEDYRKPLRKRQDKNELQHKFKYGLDDENVDIFSQKFKEEIQNKNDTLDLFEDAYAKNRNCLDIIGVDKKTIFINFGEEIRELENYLTASTRFLTDYKVKTCQQLLSDLNNRYIGIRNRLMPKKKFEFNSRKKKEIIPTKVDLIGADVTDNAELYKEKIAKEKPTVTYESSELSLNLTDLSDKYVCETGNRVNKYDIIISDLKNCFIEIRGHPGSVRVKNLTNCVILCGPTQFSIYGEGCHQTLFAFACHQFRLHCSTSCSLFLHVTSRAIIEDCRGIEVGSYNYKYDGLEQDFKDSGLDINTNNYANVADFDWLSPDAPSPNWHLTENNINWDELRQKFVKDVLKTKKP